MKTIQSILVLFLALQGVTVHAQSNPALEDQMKQIGKLFKAINLAAKDPSQNAQSASNAAKLVVLFQGSLNVIPATITALPQDQIAAATADHQKLIGQEVDAAQKLQAAFQSNDNNGAVSVLSAMSQIKIDGHTKYKPK